MQIGAGLIGMSSKHSLCNASTEKFYSEEFEPTLSFCHIGVAYTFFD